jgi:phenylalanyl-tRNA synthetase alpha chain
MIDELERLQEEALAALSTVSTLGALDDWRIAFLGKKGRMTLVLRGLGALAPEQRPAVGQKANQVKQALEEASDAATARIKGQALQQSAAAERVDVTLPGRPMTLGGLHPITQVLRRIYSIFGEMGFQVFQSPEVETDEMNFQLLNIPPDHPARDMWSTFYTTKEGVLLRTHTSPGQVRSMRKYYPEPVRVILPGKCYRYEAVTARAEFMFHQVEGLAVGKHITIADLTGVFTEFAKRLYGVDRKVRFRSSYFPFTEPSIEVDVDCSICGGKGCRICKGTGWVEISGAGMVHPVVLRNGGYDPEVYSGFAFGMGPDRVTMLKYGIDDIRYFYSNDLRFLAHFR